jgi:hypothetical protein
MHKYILLGNIEWLMDEHKYINMQTIYIGHLKNQQYDQHSYPSLCEKIQYKQ